MNNKSAIAMFAKTPGFSDVKTRLANGIGKKEAEEFYRRSVFSIEELMYSIREKINDVDVFWALAEKDSGSDQLWKNFETMWTGEGGLGERLSNVSSKLLDDYGEVIIIGTDSPHMPERIISDVVDLLKKNPDECVIGPGIDGGFYLFGSAFPLKREIWTDVAYSREDTLEQLVNNLNKHNISYKLLESLLDIDEPEDLNKLYEYLLKNKDLNNKSQNDLLNWLTGFR